MGDFRVDEAVEIVARAVAYREGHDADWTDYPEIGEHDWQRVTERVNQILSTIAPDAVAYEAAYEFLASRAEPTS